MDFAFSPEEEAFRKEVARFLEKEVPQEYREKRLTFFDMSAQHDWIKVHRKMAEKLGERGWLSIHWPEEYGGQGVSPFYRLILSNSPAKDQLWSNSNAFRHSGYSSCDRFMDSTCDIYF